MQKPAAFVLALLTAWIIFKIAFGLLLGLFSIAWGLLTVVLFVSLVSWLYNKLNGSRC